jgi:hypothetical protein
MGYQVVREWMIEFAKENDLAHPLSGVQAAILRR